MLSVLSSKPQKSQNSAPYTLWPVHLKLTHLDWNPEATLIHFQGQYLTICELDYKILQEEIQNVPKTKAAVDIGEFCLVEDLTSARWYRGRVQSRKEDLFDVFLIDHGNVLSVDIANISSCSNDLFILPPRIVCGFLANVLLLPGCPDSVVEEYLTKLIGRNVTGHIQAVLPHKVLLLETPDINNDLVTHGFGRHVDTNTFLLLVEMLTEMPLKQNTEPVPDLLIDQPRGQEYYFKPSGLQAYKDILSFCWPRLGCGTRAKVRVTAAVNPGLFYCQMASKETDLWEMSKKLAADCEYKTKECNLKTPENLGLLCAVKGEDGKWYRGFVQFLPVNSQVRVLFIDYGFFESVKVENVHRLPPDFYSTPIMAFPCSLFSISDQDEVVKTQQLSFLKAGLLGRVLDVEIKSFAEDQHLYSITVIGAGDSNVKNSVPIQELPKFKGESVFETEESLLQGGYQYHDTVLSETLGKTLEAEEVELGSVFVGYVEHVQNPHQFWIRTQKRNDDFEEMMAKMTDHFSQVKLEEDVLMNPELGTMCCAVYEEDMHFYRGVVTDTLEHGAEVLFIDFGNIEKVPHILIKKIPEEFASKSAFAFCCSLVNVFPSDEIWTSTACGFFRKAVSNKALLVHVVQMRKNKFVVDLYEMGSDSNQSITELLISSKQAEPWNNIPIEPLLHNNTHVTDKTKCPGYGVASDINGKTEQWEDCEEGEKTCNHEIEKPQAPARFKAITTKPGCEFAVRCSYINSPSYFWCQRLDKVPALEELMDKVQQYYSAHTAILQPGDSCCVAKSPQDGKWYRALITEKLRGHVRVMLVDYGCTIEVQEHNLQSIMPGYVNLEGQAFRCSLYNQIEPVDPNNCGNWSPEVCHLFKDFVRNSTAGLRCKVVSQLNVKNKWLCNVVDLCNTQTEQSITKLLLEQGLAREVTISTKRLSMVFPESFVFSSYKLSCGKEEQVYIAHISSQWEFYCHLERNTDIIKGLEKKISEESEKMRQASTKAVVSKLCLAKYWDGRWYRGLARPVQSPLHLSVFFVDYGNINISEKSQVMFIPRDSADLLYTPMQAIRCSLASVSKDELYPDVKKWLDDTFLNKQVRAHILGRSEDGSFDVELIDGEININEKVKELIASLSPKPEPVVTFKIRNTKMKLETLHTGTTKTSLKGKSQQQGHSPYSATLKANRRTQVGGSPVRKKENIKKYVHDKAQCKTPKVKQQNEANTKSCVHEKPQRNSQKKQQTEYHDTNTKSGQSQYTAKAETPQLSCLPDIKVTKGLRMTCFVSHIDSVNSFFLQLSEDEPTILKIAEELNSGIFKDSVKPTTSLRINDLVLAEYEEDGALYRSTVKDDEGSSCFKVEFVDYGNSAVTKGEKIYAIPKEYLSQPRFSIPCSLLDTSTYKNDASFTDAVMEKPLMVEFIRQSGAHWEVKVEILDEEAGLPAPLEAPVEGGTEMEKEEEAPASLIEESVRTCDQNYLREVSEKEMVRSEKIMSSVDDDNVMLKPSPATLKPAPAMLKPPLATLKTAPAMLEPTSSTLKSLPTILKPPKPPPARLKPTPATSKPQPAAPKPPPSTPQLPPATLKPPPATLKPPPATLKPPPATLKPTPAKLQPPSATPQPPPLTRSHKLKVITLTLCHRRTSARNKRDSKNNRRKTLKFSAKAKSDCAVIPPAIQAKDTENCTVLSVLNNGSFYVRLTRTSDLLAELESHPAGKLHKCKTVAEDDVKQGLKCLVQVHKDKKWQRAVVLHVRHQKCQVLLVDHGIIEEIPTCSVRRQCNNMTKVSNLAVLCKVNCFGFSEEEGASTWWCETLKPLTGSEVKLVFTCYSKPEKLWKVEIIMSGLFLVRQITASVQQNEEVAPPESRNETTQDERFPSTGQPQQFVFAPVDMDKSYSGFAAAVTTPFKFCVVLEDSHLVLNKVSLMLDNLPEQMSPLPETHLVPGTCCLLKSDTKNKWCRAEVVHADTTVICNMVDYGHHEYIPYENCSNLKRLPVEMNLPKVTYPCILRGVKPVKAEGQWTDEAAVFFTQCLYQKNLQIFFREFVSNTHWMVDILVDGVHVAKELVDAGHASYNDTTLGLRFQEQRICKECEQEDEASDVSAQSSDGAEKKMLDTAESGPSQCCLM